MEETRKGQERGKDLYLVTGAAGFLGLEVCRQLVAQGEAVRALVLPGDRAAAFIPEGVEIVEGDVLDMGSLDRLFGDSDGNRLVVLHIASVVSVHADYDPKVMAVNVDGTRNIIAQCRKAPNFKKLVYCGSTGSIPEVPRGQAHKEIDRFDPERVVGCYNKSKAAAANLVMEAARAGLNACLVHPTGILGPGDCGAVGETTKSLIEIVEGRLEVGINGSFNMVDVRDLAAAMLSAAKNGRPGENYILGNEVVTFEAFVRLIREESGCPLPKAFIPAEYAMKAAVEAEKRAAEAGATSQLTTYHIYNLAKNNVYDSSKARRELGFHPRPYQETIHDEIEFLKSRGYIQS